MSPINRKGGLGGLLNAPTQDPDTTTNDTESTEAPTTPPEGPLLYTPRRRRRKPPRDKLTVDVSLAVLEAMDALVQQEDTTLRHEVEEALRAHVTRKGIRIPKE